MTLSRRLPQDPRLVAEFDRLLRRHVSEVRDYTHAFHRRWERKGVTTMRGTAWAVRPFLLPAPRLHFLASAFHSALTALGHAIGKAAAKRGAVTRLLPVHPEFEELFDVAGGTSSPGFLSHFRPDGFLFEDRFLLSEINYGNGIIVSCGYTEAAADYWRRHPVIKRLGWDVERLHRRPLPWFINVARRFARPVKSPSIALLAHSREWRTIISFPKRVVDQIHFVARQFEEVGMRARIVTEKDLTVDRRGQLRYADDGERADLLMFITVGTMFLDEPELLRRPGIMRHLTRSRIGDTWVLKPLAGLLVEKGTLPMLNGLKPARTMQDGFRFEVPHTEFPADHGAARYLRARNDWVLKRAFDGKDTTAGAGSSGAQWSSAVDAAVAGRAYVAQRYVSMPRTEVPVFVDEKHLEWVPSRVELSPFIYDGAFGGAGVRHAPDAEGIIMTSFPPGYGYTTAFSV
ncbi:MAG TPA: hypothetical protein VE974_01530 [Thermoanaerobaculia bacterium]|nr:hypothetical protein [Thermoanaerobaculia bacterium]